MSFLQTCLGSGSYPPALAAIKRPPLALHVAGSLAALGSPMAAVIGTRKPSVAGRTFAYAVGLGLARAGWCVVSGLAEGIDGEAHRGALDAGGLTVAVLAHGLGRTVYPYSNKDLAADIAREGGALVTEHADGARPERKHFVTRDRIQSGLSRAVVLVESGPEGGSFHTLRFAREQGRPIFAVSSRALGFDWHGCERAVAEFGATPVPGMTDLLGALAPLLSDPKGTP